MLPARAVGFALLLAAPILWIGTGAMSPYPTSVNALGDRIIAEGSVDGARVRIVAWGGIPYSYDEANDTTLLYVEYCSHSLCGPLVRVAGHLRGERIGPWLLVPRDDRLTLTDAGPFELANDTFAQVGPSDGSRIAIDATFDIGSPVAPFVGRLAAIFALGAGIALAARPSWLSLAPAGLATVFGTTPATAHPSYVILVQLGGFLAFVVGVVLAIALGLIRRRIPWSALGLILAAALAVATGVLALMHFPASGAGD